MAANGLPAAYEAGGAILAEDEEPSLAPGLNASPRSSAASKLGWSSWQVTSGLFRMFVLLARMLLPTAARIWYW